MGKLLIGDVEPSDIRIGDVRPTAIYAGTEKIWPTVAALAQIKLFAQNNQLAGATGNMYYPAGIKAGDYAVLLECSRNAATPPPDSRVAVGYTKIVDVAAASNGTYRLQASWKRLDATDVANGYLAQGMDGATDFKVILIFRGYGADGVTEAPITSASATQPDSAATGAAPPNQDKTITGLNAKSVVVMYGGVATNVTISGVLSMLRDGVNANPTQLLDGSLTSGGFYQFPGGGNVMSCRMIDSGASNLLISFVFTAT